MASGIRFIELCLRGTDRDGRRPELARRLFDSLAMGAYPRIARALGYTFAQSTTLALRRDGRAVLAEVWAQEGLPPTPQELRSISERYDDATTWIVAYHHARPIGVLGLVDLRRASVSLDLERRLPPPDLDLAKTRELARLAILPEHRNAAQTVMVGLLREMRVYCDKHGVEMLFGGSSRQLFEVYRRFNPSARLIDPPRKESEPEELARYYAPLRQLAAGQGVLFLLDVRAGSAWEVFRRFSRRYLRRAWRLR